MTEGLHPPLQRTAHPHEPKEDDLEKLKKWQEARLERKLRGEYESAVFHLAELVSDAFIRIRITSKRIYNRSTKILTHHYQSLQSV
jgi:outer membrane protein insertion porin family